jgi:hypothetical protein
MSLSRRLLIRPGLRLHSLRFDEHYHFLYLNSADFHHQHSASVQFRHTHRQHFLATDTLQSRSIPESTLPLRWISISDYREPHFLIVCNDCEFYLLCVYYNTVSFIFMLHILITFPYLLRRHRDWRFDEFSLIYDIDLPDRSLRTCYFSQVRFSLYDDYFQSAPDIRYYTQSIMKCEFDSLLILIGCWARSQYLITALENVSLSLGHFLIGSFRQ